MVQISISHHSIHTQFDLVSSTTPAQEIASGKKNALALKKLQKFNWNYLTNVCVYVEE